MGIAGGNRVMALARIVGSIGGDRADVLLVGDLVQQLRQHGRITDIAGRDLDGTHLKRSSSIPMCILRHIRRSGQPCLRAFHSPSPSDLMPVLSMSRSSGPVPPRYGRLTFSVL